MAEEKPLTKKLPRRAFLKGSSLGILGGAATLGLSGPLFLKNKSPHLRPPGALNEDKFLASCIKCGQCLQVCPPQVINLAGLSHGFGIGTPYITPREGACILCAGLPCVLACPTGALDHHISEGKEAHMGLAVLSQPETCLSIQNLNDIPLRIKRIEDADSDKKIEQIKLLLKSIVHLENDDISKQFLLQNFQLESLKEEHLPELALKIMGNKNIWLEFKSKLQESPRSQGACTLCLSECPIKNENPIIFVDQGEAGPTPVVQKSCVGCGLCEMMCPTEVTSIKIIPRLNWEEKSNGK